MCGCGCNSCGSGMMGLTVLPGFHRGMRGLRGLGNLRAGSSVRIGFRYEPSLGEPSPASVKSALEGCLYTTGAFTDLSVTVETSSIRYYYVTIRGVISIDFGKAEDVEGLIKGAVNSCYPDLTVTIAGFDPFVVDRVPAGTPVDTIPVPAGTPGGPPASEAPKGPDPCMVNSATGQQRQGLDYLNCKLGLGTSSGLSTLVIPILLAVVVAKAFK